MSNTRLKPPSLARFFFAITSAQHQIHQESEDLIARKLGTLGLRSSLFSFSDFSKYYDQELGGRCWKYLVSLQKALPVDQLVPLKRFTEDVETALARPEEPNRRRTVNIDPGYLTGWQVVLASAKIHSHRLYMAHGVYCELTLLYQDKKFRPLPWTYPDYVSPAVLDFLKQLRAEHQESVRRQLPHHLQKPDGN
jgi:hypothetical protein